MISFLRKRVQYLWSCDCPPYRAIFGGRGGPKLMLVHHISCDKKVTERRTETLRIKYEEIEEAKILVVAGTRGAVTALPADLRPATAENRLGEQHGQTKQEHSDGVEAPGRFNLQL